MKIPESAKLKLNRAKHHLQCLDSEIAKFRGKTRRIRREENTEKGLYILRMEFPNPSLRMALIVGDAAGCMRASLDHLAWRLAIAGLNSRGQTRRPTGRCSFPIIGVKDKTGIKRFREATEDMHYAPRNVIESLQPYHRRAAYKDSLLWKLNKLAATDKHLNIAIGGHGINVNFPKFPQHLGAALVPFDDENGVGVAVPLALKEYMEFDPQAALEIAWGDLQIGLKVTREDLWEIHNFIRDHVFPGLSCFLPKSVGSDTRSGARVLPD